MSATTKTAAPGHGILAAYLKHHGISQKDFALAVGCSSAAVSMWVAGRYRPSPEWRPAIAKATEGAVSVEHWLTDSELSARVWKVRHLSNSDLK